MQQRQVYDVAIVGSGAGGGMAAYVLTKAGARVVMLEAGPKWFASKDSKMLTPNYATADGRSTVSRTRARPARSSAGGARACSAGARITGGGSRCALDRTISAAR